jgi:hypothetical protein
MSPRIVRCRLDNASDRALKRVSFSASDGKWTQEPPTTIGSKGHGEWAIESTDWNGGADGGVDYADAALEIVLHVSWENPFCGSNRCEIAAEPDREPVGMSSSISDEHEADAAFRYWGVEKPTPPRPPSQGDAPNGAHSGSAPPETTTTLSPPEVTPNECKYLEAWDNDGVLDKKYDDAELILDRLRSPDVFVSRVMEVSHALRRGKAEEPAHQHDLTILGRNIFLFMPPNGPPKGMWLPDADMTAKALACLPDSALDGIANVILTPYANLGFDASVGHEVEHPNDVAWTVASERTIWYHARDTAKTQGDLDWVFMHEGGHVSSYAFRTGDLYFSASTDWRNAMGADQALGTSGVSQYGDNSPEEDYAESVLMYAMTVGTSCEKTARRRFPNRYDVLAKQYAGQFIRRNGS